MSVMRLRRWWQRGRGDAQLGRGRRSFARPVGLGLLAAMAWQSAAAQPSAAPVSKEPIVELPPMIVAESAKGLPWLHGTVGNLEFLSRCSLSTTKSFVAAQVRIHQSLSEFVPEQFFAKNAIPTISIVVPKDGAGTDDALLQQMMKTEAATLSPGPKSGETVVRRVPAGEGGGQRIQFLPNMRLDDRDITASFTYWDEKNFDSSLLVIANTYLHSRLTRRTPMLPQWFIEGVTALFEQTAIREGKITLQPFRWISHDWTTELVRDPEARRVMLPTPDLFAPNALLGTSNNTFLRAAIWRPQAALFVRWALDPANGGQAGALWKFAERVSREAVSEQIFTECFGFGYTDLMDRLSDYLPVAVKNAVSIPLRGEAPKFEVKPATPTEIARLRGDWERLEIGAVRGSHPQYLTQYIEQARRTIRRATSAGEQDPQLLAAAALCEVDAGDATAARPLLEQAVATRVVRPRVYLELARLRWLDVTSGNPASRKYSAQQLQPVVELLRAALEQTPLLPEVMLLMADVWLRAEEPISSLELERLNARLPELRRYPLVAFRVAELNLQLGKRKDAVVLLAEAFPFITDNEMRARYQQLFVGAAAK